MGKLRWSDQSKSVENGKHTWEQVKTSVLRPNVLLLYWMGLWPLESSWLYSGFTVVNVGFCAVCITLHVASVCDNLSDIEQVTSASATILPMSGGLLNSLLLLRHHQSIRQMVQRLDDLVNSQRRFLSDTQVESLFVEARHQILRIMLVVSGYLFVIAAYWIVIAFLEPPSNRVLPFVQYPWMSSSGSFHFWSTFALQFYTAPYCSYATLFIQFFFLAVMVHVSAQFNILSTRVASLGHSRVSRQVTDSKSASAPEDGDAEYQDLCLCIETHQELLRFVRVLNDVMSPFAMLQFIAGTLAVCVVLFQATQNPDFNNNLKCAGWLPGPGSELFMYCWAAHEVVQAGESLCEAVYSSLWYDLGPRSARAVRLMMTRAQVPPVLTAGHLYPITRATFVSLVNAAYSYYALLSQIHNK